MALEESINLACEKLPDGWQIRIDMERGYAGVIAIRPDGTEANMHEDETDLEQQVRAVLILARDESIADKWSAKALEAACPRGNGAVGDSMTRDEMKKELARLVRRIGLTRLADKAPIQKEIDALKERLRATRPPVPPKGENEG